MQQQQQQKLTETEELSVPNNTETSQIKKKEKTLRKPDFLI